MITGLPLYASANATVPILNTLVAEGVPLGTGMALIMFAVGVLLPELVLLKPVLTVRLLVWFAVIVSAGVVLVPYLFNALPPDWQKMALQTLELAGSRDRDFPDSHSTVLAAL